MDYQSKNDNIICMYRFLTFLIIFFSFEANSQWNPKESSSSAVKTDVAATIDEFKSNPNLTIFFEQAQGYVVFPSIKKAGFGIGGSTGKGQVFEKGELVGDSSVTQISIGIQFGGQAFKEIIFFRDKEALNRFTRGNFEFGAQASAVALTTGVAVEAEYSNGVAIFTETIGGLMYEASVGGQKFTFQPQNK
jgi:lipid-binding SYLF domain-containing protein